MSLSYKKFYTYLAPLILAIFLLHSLLMRAFQSWELKLDYLIQVYLFLTLLTAIHFLLIVFFFKKWPKQAGFLFIGLSLFKMLISALFLIPFIHPLHNNSTMLAMNFLVVYFVLLFYEVFFIAKNVGKNH